MKGLALLNKEEILSKVDGANVAGVTFLRSLSVGTTKSGGTYSFGSLAAGGDVDYKIWSGSTNDYVVKENLTNVLVNITGTVNVWSGTTSVIIKTINVLSKEELDSIDISALSITKYDLDESEKEFYKLLKSNLSENGLTLFRTVYDDIRVKFRSEFAAVKIHDAYPGGLLAHTRKMLKILDFIWNTYPNISSSISKDLAFIGIAFHDMGKILEYENGSLSDIHWATHNFLGQEILFGYKDKVIELFDREFYYRLQSIIMQHHGEFGEPCHTVEAYLVHLVDMFESRIEILEESLPFTGELRVEFGKYRLK